MSDPNRPPFDPHQPPSAFPPNSPHAPPGSAGMPPQPVPYATPMSYGYPGPYTGPTPTPDDRTWGMLAHLAALAGFIVPVVGNIVGPLIVWLTKKEQQPFVDDQGKESLNFQITVVIVAFVAALTICIGIGIVLLPLVGLVALIFEIIAAVQANQGVAYRYPFNIRFIK